MTELIDSIAIESARKRVPKSRSGKLLVAVRDKIIRDMKEQVKQQKFHVPTDLVNVVRRLNARIENRFVQEDNRQYKQLDIGLKTFQIRYIRPGQKRVRISNIDATNKRAALGILRKRWGKGTVVKESREV